MRSLIFIAIIVIIVRAIKANKEDRAREDAAREREQIRQEQARLRLEDAQNKANIVMLRERMKQDTRIQIESEKARLAWQKRQDAINRQAQTDRERLRKEQERQAQQLEKHEEQIAKLRFAVKQNAEDIEFYTQRQAELYAQLDNLLLLQAGTVPGSTKHTEYQNKIVAKNNQIHAAECKLAKAQFCKAQAEKKLTA